MKHHRQNADAGPQEPQLTPEDEVALEWLVSNRPEPKSVEGLLHWLFLLSRAARPNDDANVDDLANASIKIRRSTTDERLRWILMLALARSSTFASIKIRRSTTDERLRWSLPCFLMILALLMVVMVWLDAAHQIELKPGTLMAINGSLFASVTALLTVVVRFFFGKIGSASG